VRERQQILRLPDTGSMKVVIRANETQVSKLEVGQQAYVSVIGVSGPVRATLTRKSPVADSGSRYWNPDLKEYPIELTLDRTPPELASDIMDRGIMLAGGGSLLQGLDERLREETQMPAHRAESPLTCVAVGSGRSLEEFEAIHRSNRNSRHNRKRR